MENSVSNMASTSFEIFNTVELCAIFADLALDNVFGEEIEHRAKMLGLRKEGVEKLIDFYCSPDWFVRREPR